MVHYGIPCYEMEVGDVCLPPGHRDAKHTDDSLVFDAFRRYSNHMDLLAQELLKLTADQYHPHSHIGCHSLIC